MAHPAALRSPLAGGAAVPIAERVRELRSRIERMQEKHVIEPHVPVTESLRTLLPEGLRCGAVYRVEGSHSLLMALLAESSASGSWCAVVAAPEFGIEAAADFGLDLERLVLIPNARGQWLSVVASLTEAVRIVAVRPSGLVSEADAARLAARLRQHECVLLALGAWPQAEAVIRVNKNSWTGIGPGRGRLMQRQARVEVLNRAGSLRSDYVDLNGRAAASDRGSRATPAPRVFATTRFDEAAS